MLFLTFAAAFAAETGASANALTLNSTSLGLKKGESATLQVSSHGTVLDGISGSSSNTGVATCKRRTCAAVALGRATVTAATADDIKLGVYHVSYATTPEIAAQEAQMCLNILNGRHLDYPIYIDIEQPSRGILPKDQLSTIVSSFNSVI